MPEKIRKLLGTAQAAALVLLGAHLTVHTSSHTLANFASRLAAAGAFQLPAWPHYSKPVADVPQCIISSYRAEQMIDFTAALWPVLTLVGGLCLVYAMQWRQGHPVRPPWLATVRAHAVMAPSRDVQAARATIGAHVAAQTGVLDLQAIIDATHMPCETQVFSSTTSCLLLSVKVHDHAAPGSISETLLTCVDSAIARVSQALQDSYHVTDRAVIRGCIHLLLQVCYSANSECPGMVHVEIASADTPPGGSGLETRVQQLLAHRLALGLATCKSAWALEPVALVAEDWEGAGGRPPPRLVLRGVELDSAAPLPSGSFRIVLVQRGRMLVDRQLSTSQPVAGPAARGLEVVLDGVTGPTQGLGWLYVLPGGERTEGIESAPLAAVPVLVVPRAAAGELRRYFDGLLALEQHRRQDFQGSSAARCEAFSRHFRPLVASLGAALSVLPPQALPPNRSWQPPLPSPADLRNLLQFLMRVGLWECAVLVVRATEAAGILSVPRGGGDSSPLSVTDLQSLYRLRMHAGSAAPALAPAWAPGPEAGPGTGPTVGPRAGLKAGTGAGPEASAAGPQDHGRNSKPGGKHTVPPPLAQLAACTPLPAWTPLTGFRSRLMEQRFVQHHNREAFGASGTAFVLLGMKVVYYSLAGGWLAWAGHGRSGLAHLAQALVLAWPISLARYRPTRFVRWRHVGFVVGYALTALNFIASCACEVAGCGASPGPLCFAYLPWVWYGAVLPGAVLVLFRYQVWCNVLQLVALVLGPGVFAGGGYAWALVTGPLAWQLYSSYTSEMRLRRSFLAAAARN